VEFHPALKRWAIFANLETRGFHLRERDEFAFVEDDGLGAAQQLPPFPGAAGGDQENEGNEGEGDHGVEAPDRGLTQRRIGHSTA